MRAERSKSEDIQYMHTHRTPENVRNDQKTYAINTFVNTNEAFTF